MTIQTTFRSCRFPAWLVLGAGLACSEDSHTPRPPVAAVEISGSNGQLRVGDTVRLNATPRDQDGDSLPGRTVTWATEDALIATVSPEGLVTGVAPGGVEISATSEGIRSVLNFTILNPPGPPASLSAWPGPGYAQVTVRWPQVDSTVNYVVYWQTTPGVTPGTANRVEVTGLEFLHSGLTAGTTYYYAVAAVSDGEGDRSSEVHATASSALALNLLQPKRGKLIARDLFVALQVTSQFQVAAVVANAAGRSLPLSFSASTILDSTTIGGPPFRGAGWTGSIDLTGLPRGPIPVTVTVTDVNGATAVASSGVVYDQPPVIVVLAPLDASVAHPSLQAAATCQDDDPAGCSLLQVFANGGPTFELSNGMPVEFQLGDRAGHEVTLTFRATDSRGQVRDQVRRVFAESSNRLTEVVSVGGTIRDVQPTRVLFTPGGTFSDTAKIRDWVSGSELAVNIGLTITQALLTPDGAIIQAVQGPDYPLFHWTGAGLTNLGLSSPGSLVVRGGFAVWKSPAGVVRYEVATGQSVPVTASSLSTADVGTNGDVVYVDNPTGTPGEPYQILRYRSGSTTQLTFDPSQFNLNPITDGGVVAYLKSPPGSPQTWSVAAFDASGEHPLTPADPSFPTRFLVAAGWIGFSRRSPTMELQVWRRNPAGQEQQVTAFGSSSEVRSLGENGELVLMHAEGASRQLYLDLPGQGGPAPVASDQGTAFVRGGITYIAVGRTLFRVTP